MELPPTSKQSPAVASTQTAVSNQRQMMYGADERCCSRLFGSYSEWQRDPRAPFRVCQSNATACVHRREQEKQARFIFNGKLRVSTVYQQSISIDSILLIDKCLRVY